MRALIVFAVIAGACTARAAETVTVAPEISSLAAPGSGEAQSTVVPPGKKKECPNGRFLASNYARRPPAAGLVQGRNLDDLNGALIPATFDRRPHPEDYRMLTNDHDLVSLSTGDILYITGAGSKAPLASKPDWFDVAYRGDFGPGARSVVLAWRSTDCGQTFHFISEFDPARVLDGSCAYPQMPRKTTAPGSEQKPVYDMGGSDGQLAKVNLLDDRLYMTFQCVGYLPAKGRLFELSTARLNRTLVVASLDGGESWSPIGILHATVWRGGIAPMAGRKLAFGVHTAFAVAQLGADGSLAVEPTALPVPNAKWGWDQDTFYKNKSIPQDLIHANMWASTIVARAGISSKLILTFPVTIFDRAHNATHGYRAFIFDPDKRSYRELDPIVPSPRSPNNFIMHLAAIELLQGPVLLYWSEFQGLEKKGTVRGRIIFDELLHSSDFAISRANGAARSWDLPPGKKNWYGDYQTASGYGTAVARPGAPSLSRYRYYPMWVEPDNRIHFTEVAIETDPAAPANIKLNLDTGPDILLKTALGPERPAGRMALSRMPTVSEEADSDRDGKREGRGERDRDRTAVKPRR